MNRSRQKEDPSVEEQIKLNNLQNQLDSLYLERAKGAFIRSRARWLEEGEKKTYFFGLEKQRQTKKKINILLVNNLRNDSQEQINEEIEHFYKKLYESNFSLDGCQTFFEIIRPSSTIIDESFRQHLE